MFAVASQRRLFVLTLMAAALGFAGGGAAWVLIRLIALITNLALRGRWSVHTVSFQHFHPGWPLFVAAVVGALCISALAHWSPVIRGHGIPEAMEAVLTKQSRIAPRTALAKPLSAAIAIGTGAPFGAEGPIIVTGGSLGSLLGQLLPVSPTERKILLASGAAAGMAATFGAPLAAVVLAIELLLFEFSVRAFVPLVTASAIAGGVHSVLFGSGPLFTVPSHDYAGLGVLIAFVLLGVACGVLAIVLTRGLFGIEAMYRRLPVSETWHPVIGAIVFAAVGLIVPRVLGVGYDVIGDVLAGRFTVGVLAGIAIAKLIAWWFALGSGTSGGTLAPILLISASFGSVVGAGLNHVVPGRPVALGAYAVVAMAATFGAATRATFTSMVFVFELTRDYNVILPLMLATVVADLIYSAVNTDSLMTEKLRRRGLHLGRHYGVDPFTTTHIREIMTPGKEVVTLPRDATIDVTRQLFASHRHGAFPIVDDGKLVGIVARGDVLRDGSHDDASVVDIASTDVVCVAPHDLATVALQRMATEGVEHIPVVDGGGRLVGMCTRTDLLKVRRLQLALEHPEEGLVSRIARIRRRSHA